MLRAEPAIRAAIDRMQQRMASPDRRRRPPIALRSISAGRQRDRFCVKQWLHFRDRPESAGQRADDVHSGME
jgi:hypothetical protein